MVIIILFMLLIAVIILLYQNTANNTMDKCYNVKLQIAYNNITQVM